MGPSFKISANSSLKLDLEMDAISDSASLKLDLEMYTVSNLFSFKLDLEICFVLRTALRTIQTLGWAV